MAVGFKWHYDVTGAEPIIRDVRVYNSGALSNGTVMAYGPVATTENGGCAIRADADDVDNVIGVLMEDRTAAQLLSVVAEGVDMYAKLCINPFAVWLGEWSQHADNDEVTTTATQKVLTVTMVTNHLRGWAYVTDEGSSTAGFGNLFQVGAVGTTASITAATSYDDNMTATSANVDTFIVIPAPFSADVAGGSIELSAATGEASMKLKPYETTATTGAIVILENYIMSKARSLEPLVCAKHSGNNYKGEDPSFYGDAMFIEHLLSGSGGTVCNRVIT